MIRDTPWSVYIRDYYRDLLAGVSVGALICLPLKVFLGLLAAGFAASPMGAVVLVSIGVLTGLIYLINRLLDSEEKRTLLFSEMPDEAERWATEKKAADTQIAQLTATLDQEIEEYLYATHAISPKHPKEAREAVIDQYKKRLADEVSTTKLVTRDALDSEVDKNTWTYKIKRFLGIGTAYTRDAVVVESVTDLDLHNMISSVLVAISLAISAVVTLFLSPFIYMANESEDCQLDEHKAMKNEKNTSNVQRTHLENQLQTLRARSTHFKERADDLIASERRALEALEQQELDETGLILDCYELMRKVSHTVTAAAAEVATDSQPTAALAARPIYKP